MTFTGRTALVTGAGRGIGKGIAEQLAHQGVKLICVSKHEASCGTVAAAITAQGGSAVARAIDVADGPAVASAAGELIEEFGQIDILVNNAGITRDGLIARMSPEDWHAVIQINLTSAFHWTKAIGWPMCRQRWGRIVNISSVSGIMGNAGQANYAAAKAGLIGFSKSVAKEFARRNVTVNVVAPGFIQTDMTAELSEEVQKGVTELIPLRRFGTTDDIAHATVFLCSEESAYVTGQVFTVDGGLAM